MATAAEKIASHQQKWLSEKLWLLRAEGALCDVILVIQDEEIAAHRVILSACSPALLYALTTTSANPNEGPIRVRFDNCSYKTCLSMLEYMYTGKLPAFGELSAEFRSLATEWQLHTLDQIDSIDRTSPTASGASPAKRLCTRESETGIASTLDTLKQTMKVTKSVGHKESSNMTLSFQDGNFVVSSSRDSDSGASSADADQTEVASGSNDSESDLSRITMIKPECVTPERMVDPGTSQSQQGLRHFQESSPHWRPVVIAPLEYPVDGHWILDEDSSSGVDIEASASSTHAQILSASTVKHSNSGKDDGKEEEKTTSADDHVLDSVKLKRNKNTAQKTEQVVKRFQAHILETYEDYRPMEKVEPTKLNYYIANFLLSARKRDGEEYEPDTLTAFQGALDRHLRECDYDYSILRSEMFESSRHVLATKRKALMQAGLGNRPNASRPITEQDEEKFWALGLLGATNPRTLQDTLLVFFTKTFGWKGCDDAKQCKFGDIVVQEEDGVRYLEWTGRITKTRGGGKESETGPCRRRLYETGGERCAVRLFELYISKRPLVTRDPRFGFFLTPKQKTSLADDVCYITTEMGINYLSKVVSKIASQAGLVGRYTNNSLLIGQLAKEMSNMLASGRKRSMDEALGVHGNSSLPIEAGHSCSVAVTGSAPHSVTRSGMPTAAGMFPGVNIIQLQYHDPSSVPSGVNLSPTL